VERAAGRRHAHGSRSRPPRSQPSGNAGKHRRPEGGSHPRQVREIDIGADEFRVHVQGGVATIIGKTDVIQHKGVTTHLARSAGAVAVNNVRPSDAAKQKAAANLATRRRAQIKRGDAPTFAACTAEPPEVLIGVMLS
jgi:hypothetical protein